MITFQSKSAKRLTGPPPGLYLANAVHMHIPLPWCECMSPLETREVGESRKMGWVVAANGEETLIRGETESGGVVNKMFSPPISAAGSIRSRPVVSA